MKKLIIVTLLFTFVASCVSSELNSLPNKIVVNLGSDEIILSSPDGYCINEKYPTETCLRIFHNFI